MQGKYAPAPMPFEELKQRHAVVWSDEEKREDLPRAFVELDEADRTDGGIRFRRTYLLTRGTRN